MRWALVDSVHDVTACLSVMGPVVSCDIETDDISPLDANILCVGISDGERTVVVEPWKPSLHHGILSQALSDRTVVFHNGRGFDIMLLTRDGVQMPAKVEDTLLAHHAYASHFPQRLDQVVSEFCDAGPWKQEHGMRGGMEKGGKLPKDMTAEKRAYYCACDCALTALSWQRMQPDLEPHRSVYEHDKQLADLAMQMQLTGIGVDLRAKSELASGLAKRQSELKVKLRALTWAHFEPSKNRDVSRALYETLGAPISLRTPTGAPATNTAVLAHYAQQDTQAGEFARLLTVWRLCAKVKSTYVDAIPVRANGRAAYGWKSFGTVSGRMAGRLQSCPRYGKLPEQKPRELYIATGQLEKARVVMQVHDAAAFEVGKSLVYFDLCFAKGTGIYTPAGPVAIEDLKVGDAVYTYRHKEGRPAVGKITQHVNVGVGDSVKVTLDNGNVVRCTPDHKWFVVPWGAYGAPEEVRADALKPGDRLLARQGHNCKVVSVEPDGKADMWSIAVDPDHNYALAAGVFVKNCQAEARLAAYISGDPALIAAIQQDIHLANALVIFGSIPSAKARLERGNELSTFKDHNGKLLKWKAVSRTDGGCKEERDVSKNAGFAVWYVASAERVFETLNSRGFPVTLRACEAMCNRFAACYYKYYQFVERNLALVREQGYIRTVLTGRFRWLGYFPGKPDVANFPVQSGIADVMNIRLVEMAKAATNMTKAEDVKALITETWAAPIVLPKSQLVAEERSFILPADIKIGERWSDF